jgi:acyl-CoA reductase-like NAD-dependent aldehyde dehydrogenase
VGERTRLYIDGRWEDADRHLPVLAPWDGRHLADMAVGDLVSLDRAVAGARAVLDAPLSAARRAGVLDRAADLVAVRRDRLAETIALEAGKPIRTARAEVDRTVETLRFSGVEARGPVGESLALDADPAGDGLAAFTMREPVGVVAAIIPFNFPLNLVAHKLGPAVAAGCPVVLKPAERAPLSALRLTGILTEAGLPAGWLQVVTGTGADLGAALAAHPDIDAVTFTGSGAVAAGLQATAPGRRMLLELGSAAPLVVEQDGDVKAAAERIVRHGFGHAGQSCVSIQRVLVHDDRRAELVEALAAAAETLVVGDPMDEATDVSCLITPDAAERVRRAIAEAVTGGAKVLSGGHGNGSVVAPTVILDVSPSAALMREEIFGPVVAVNRFTSTDEAIATINGPAPVINAGVFTASLDRALRYVREVRAGTVLVNESPTFRVDRMPYGGNGAAGNTREGPRAAVRELTVEKLAILRGVPA